MLCQPSLQVGWAAEIQQRLGQCLQLLQRQTLDAHGDGVAEAAAAAVELTQGDGGCLCSPAAGFALLPAFLSALLNPLLGNTGVA